MDTQDCLVRSVMTDTTGTRKMTLREILVPVSLVLVMTIRTAVNKTMKEGRLFVFVRKAGLGWTVTQKVIQKISWIHKTLQILNI